MSLADGRRFVRNRRWHKYNGAEVAHKVERFVGERITLVLHTLPGLEADPVSSVSDSPVAGRASPAMVGTTSREGVAGDRAEDEEGRCEGGCTCDCMDPREPVMAVKKSYRNVGKKERQAELFPELEKEIAAKRAELYRGVRWPDSKARWSDEYYRAMQDAVKDRIGGDADQQLSLIHI